MATQPSGSRYILEVPLDASEIDDRKPEQRVRVLAQGAKGPLDSHVVQFDEKGHALAKFNFASAPGGITLYLGPEEASDEDLPRLQTIHVGISARRWAGQSALKLPPIVISRYYWHWWWLWCRKFTISGRVLCPDGSPVAGAKVCAYDVDWWWWFSSTQQIACATTDLSGAFSMTFTWCCGWWPWWYWESRLWQLDPVLVERIAPVLQRNPDLHVLTPRTIQPSLADFQHILGAEAALLGAAAKIDPTALARLREPLLKRLPASEELRQAYIWPWYPWQPPWNDCNPDVIFKVTQNCSPSGDPSLIVNETVWDVRWNIPTSLNVTLTANDQACCLPPSTPCGDPECLDLTMACGLTVDGIAGNIGAPPAPAVLTGLYDPGGSATYSDRPFGGTVPISGTAECMGNNVDYYEFEWMTRAAWNVSSAGPWNVMPPNANGAFTRKYLDFPSLTYVPVTFAPQSISGRNVYESLKHYEQNNSPSDWNFNRFWVSNRDLLINWLTQNFTPGDGSYYLQVTGYDEVAGALVNPRVLHICQHSDPNYIALTIDNRIVGPGPNDWHGDDCQTVHTCTREPDTKIVSIKILNASQYGGVDTNIDPCGIYKVHGTDKVQIDFIAHDPDGYLAQYDLNTHWGVNLSRNLLAAGFTHTLSPAISSWSGAGPVPIALQKGPTYAEAFSAPQGGAGIRPRWDGGVISLVCQATDYGGVQGAFPVSCCYQLRLDAWKRTIVSCSGLFINTSETSFTIEVV